MSAPSLSSSTGLAEYGETTTAAFYHNNIGKGFHPDTSADAARLNSAQENGGAATTVSHGAHSNELREHPTHGVKSFASMLAEPEMPLQALRRNANNEQHQHKRLGVARPQHDLSMNADPVIGGVPSSTAQVRPPPPPLASSASDASGETASSAATQSNSITSSQYLYAIQKDLEALVQLQQQQLLAKVEDEVQRQPPPIIPQTTPPSVRPSSQQQHQKQLEVQKGKSERLLQSIDSVKQAFVQSAAHLLPPPPMPSTVSPSHATGVVASSILHEKSTEEFMPHEISNTSLLPRQSANEDNDDHDNNGQAASAQSAHIAALPPPPPSSSPIPASLLEYHAYLMQLEHQQRQHYEVLRRQQKQQKRKEKDPYNAHVRGATSKGGTGDPGVSATPPRQRIGAAAGGDTTVCSAKRQGLKDRRDRSPPLALMLRTMRHRDKARMGVNSGGHCRNSGGGTDGNYLYYGWNGAYTDDEKENGEVEEEKDASRDGVDVQHELPAAEQSSEFQRSNATPGKRQRTTQPRDSINQTLKPLRVCGGDGGGRDDEEEASGGRCNNKAVPTDMSLFPRQQHSLARQASPPKNRPRHTIALIQTNNDNNKAHMRSPEREEKGLSHKAQRIPVEEELQQQTQQRQSQSHSRKSSPAQRQTSAGLAGRPHQGEILDRAPPQHYIRDDGPAALQAPHTPPLSAPPHHQLQRPVVVAPSPDKRTDDLTANLPGISPIKPTSSSLEGKLDGLSLLNNHHDESHPQAASQSSSGAPSVVAAAADSATDEQKNHNGIPAGTASSSSPVEAFADALLLDLSGSPGGVAGGGGGMTTQLVTGKGTPLATATAAAATTALAMHPPLGVPFAKRSVATAGTTTAMVGGTAAIHEPIAFSTSPAGFIVSINAGQQQQPNGNAKVSQPNTAQNGIVDYTATGSATTASISKSPDRDLNKADIMVVGPTVASGTMFPQAIAATLNPRASNPRDLIGGADQDVPYNGSNDAGQHGALWRRRSPVKEATAMGNDAAPHVAGDSLSFASFQERYAHHHLHHHHRRRSFEDISSMIPEHGTGTPRSSRYRPNSTGTGTAGVGNYSRRQRRPRVGGVRHWSTKKENDEEEHERDDDDTAIDENREGEGGEEERAPRLTLHLRRVPRHRNNAAQHAIMMLTDDAPQQESKRAVKDTVVMKNRVECLPSGQRRKSSGGTDSKPKPSWRSARASDPPAVCRAASRENPQRGNSSRPAVVSASHRGKNADQTSTEDLKNPSATGTTTTRSHLQNPPHHPQLATPSVAEVWHKIKRMWAPGPSPQGPFASAYRYHPHTLSTPIQDDVTMASSSTSPSPLLLLRPWPTPPQRPPSLAHKDPQVHAHRQTAVSSANKNTAGKTDGAVEDAAVAAAAVAVLAAAPHLSPSANAVESTAAPATTSLGAPPPPPSPPPTVDVPPKHRAHPAQTRLHKAQRSQSQRPSPTTTVPLFFMTDSLIGAALQDVLPVCRARQREVAREVDRRRYQLTPVSSSSVA